MVCLRRGKKESVFEANQARESGRRVAGPEGQGAVGHSQELRFYSKLEGDVN